MILVIYLITVLTYFSVLRAILSKDLMLLMNTFFELILTILLGFLPIGNIAFTIIMICESGLYTMPEINVDRILRKMLFVKDKRDKEWH